MILIPTNHRLSGVLFYNIKLIYINLYKHLVSMLVQSIMDFFLLISHIRILWQIS